MSWKKLDISNHTWGDTRCYLTTGHWCYCGFVVMAIVAVAFGVLNFLTPEYHDDFVYKFMFEGGTVNYDHPVRSLGDIIASQIDHYHSVNGRSIVHFLVQLFTGLLGKSVFNVFNVLVFCAFLWLLQRRTKGAARCCVSTLLPLVLVLLLPRFKDTFLWMTGSINYLWSATAALLFLMIYEKCHATGDTRCCVSTFHRILMLVAAFLLGWTHEGITLPLAASLVIINLFPLKSCCRKQGLWLALAYLAGGLMIVLAPGTIARSGMSGGLAVSTLGLKVITGFTVLARLKIVYLALIATIITWLINRETVKRIIARNGYLLLAILLSLGIVFTSGLESTRTAFGLEFFAMIYLLQLIAEYAQCRDAKSCVSRGEGKPEAIRWCTWGLAAALIIFYALLLRHAIPSWQESRRLIAQIEQCTDAKSCVSGIIATNEHDSGIFSSYICTMLSPDSTVNAMNYNPHSWPASIAATYQCDSLVFLPQAFLDDLKANPSRYEKIDLNTPFEFYVQRIDCITQVDQVDFLLAPNDFKDVPLLFRPIARRMNRYTDTTVTTSKWVTLNLYGRRYLLIKRDHSLQHRLRDIRIQKKNQEY